MPATTQNPRVLRQWHLLVELPAGSPVESPATTAGKRANEPNTGCSMGTYGSRYALQAASLAVHRWNSRGRRTNRETPSSDAPRLTDSSRSSSTDATRIGVPGHRRIVSGSRALVR